MRSHLVVVRYETEDGRTLEATSRPLTRRAARRMADQYNVCSRPYVRGCQDTRVAHVVYSWNHRRPYSVQEVAAGHSEGPEARADVVQGPYGPEASEPIPEDGSGAQRGGSWCEGGMPAHDRSGFLPPRKDIP